MGPGLLRHDLLKVSERSGASKKQIRGPAAACQPRVIRQQPGQQTPIVFTRICQGHHLRIAPRGDTRTRLDERRTTCHPRPEIPADGPEHDDESTGHVLAAMITYALDHGDCAAVADGKALACAPGNEHATARCPVQRRVADQHVI